LRFGAADLSPFRVVVASPSSESPSPEERLRALEQQLAALVEERDRLARERDEFKQQAAWFQAQLERLRDEAKTPRERVDPRQVQLVFEPFAAALLGEAARPAPTGGDGNDGKKKTKKVTPHGRRVLPEHLPIETVVLAPSPLPEHAVRIGTEVSWRLGFRAASYYRLRVLRPIFVVPKAQAEACSEVEAFWEPATKAGAATDATVATDTGATTDASAATSTNAAPATEPPPPAGTDAIAASSTSAPVASTGRVPWPSGPTSLVYAPAPDEMVPRGLPLPDLLANVLVRKFADHLPWHRQETIAEREGIRLTRGTLCGWVETAHKLARYVVDAMAEDAKAHARVIATDATGVLVRHPERCKKGHFWVYVADRDHVFYRYSATHSHHEPEAFFRGYRGTVLSDASNVFDVLFGLPEGPGEANCWSHLRRYFFKAIDSENVDEALVGVGFSNALFELEREWRKLAPEERLHQRRERSAPVVEALRRWRDEQLARAAVVEGSRLRKALNYLTNQWKGLTHFLENGHVAIHNNESERQLRRLAVGRANWLFVGSDETAPWTCTFVSLIASAQLHGLSPQTYLRDLFRVLPVWPKTRMLELSPKHWRATRARLDEAQMAMPLGPVTVPKALEAISPTAA
jgi:transposase